MVSNSKSSSSTGKCFPPGFRFHPTDEELVLYYLKRKICRRSVKLDIIGEVDVYKWDPEELPGLSKLKSGDRQWFFFSPRDRKYPNGGRSSRATMHGYWKATGKDRIIKRRSSTVGVKKTLVYYQGRAPSGLRTDWVMHEYIMDEQELRRCPAAQEHYVLYKIFKKSGPGPKNGEQYGAPFVEEEWDDEDCLDVDSLLVQKLNPIPLNEFHNTDTRKEEEEEQQQTGLSNDVTELLNSIIDEPEIRRPEWEVVEKNENGNVLLEGSSSRVEKDFLELDDLIGPEMGICDSVACFDSFPEYDFYNMGDLVYGPGPENGLNDELPISYDLWNHYDQGDNSTLTSQTSQTIYEPVSSPLSGVITEENTGKPENTLDQSRENIKPYTDSDSWLSSALWAFLDSIPTTPASASESSELVNKAFEGMSSFRKGRNVNLAATAAAASGGGTSRRLEKAEQKPKSKPVSSSRGIVYFSVLGVLFAMLWVFVGSSIELLNRFV